MIRSIVTKNPRASKWMVMSPALMKEKEKQQKRKKQRQDKKAEKKRQREDEDDTDDDDMPKAKKKGKKKADNEDDPRLPPVELTGYIHILKPTPTLPSRSRTKPKPESLYIKRGPFQFMFNCSFNTFDTSIAKTLPCSASHLVLEKTEWKPQTPANRASLPLGGNIGFEVLQKQICVTKDKIVIITMPGPQKPAEDAPSNERRQFWPTNDDSDDSSGAGGSAGPSKTAHGAKQEFDFAELEATSTEESVAEQKLSFDKAVAPHVEELKERWPENDAGKRIYPDDKGFQWELTPIQLNIWGSHMMSLAPMQSFTPAPAPMPAVLPPAEPSPVKSAPSSPAKKFHRAVSLEEFHYDRLQKLEYEPGDKGIFWGSTDNFLKDAQAGLWA
ncbi:hypothetical protein B0H14DRAFT_2644410 [Mycena olivaceomarginata]|nr:hypothetical protein B0H14DRAFT_2644410 [Mycena olivaceomarginata]